MSTDPVVETVHGSAHPPRLAVADVVVLEAPTKRAGLARARALLAELPGLTLVAVDLPDDTVFFVSAWRCSEPVARRAGLVEQTYHEWVGELRLPAPRTAWSACAG